MCSKRSHACSDIGPTAEHIQGQSLS